jgi:hypothetical protein
MNEIVQLLMKKTGLAEDKATMAVDVVVGFLREKLPGPVGAQIDSLMTGEAGVTEKLGGIASSLGGMFAKKQ